MSKLRDVDFSVLDLASVRDTDEGVAPALHRSLALARKAEQLGYKRFWVAEHHNMDAIVSSATSVLMGYLASGTERIRIGAGGIMLPNHSPLVIAEQFGTLEALYPGRIDLGLGRAPGSDPFTAQALRRGNVDSADQFPQDVDILQQLLGCPQPNQRVIATPGANSHVPLWLLGSSLFSAQLAGYKGLPYAFASHFAPRYLLDALRIYRDRFEPSKVLRKPHAMVGIPLILADNDERAQYLATSTYQRILALFRGQSMKLKLPVDDMHSLWSASEEASVKDFLGMAAIGGPEQVKAYLEQVLEKTQADELIFTCDFYDEADRHRAFELLAQIKAQ